MLSSPMRPALSRRQIRLRSPSSSNSDAERARKRFRSSSPASESEKRPTLRIHIVQAKVDEKEMQDLYRLVHDTQAHNDENVTRFELTTDHAEADVIITNLRMKKRLERHIPWNIARQKSILTPAWLHRSVKDGHPAERGPYAAFQELHNSTTTHCPTDDAQEYKQEDSSGLPLSPPQIDAKPTSRAVFENWKAKYACQRASPMVCLNQALAAELNVLARSRELEGLSMNALSYEKSVAIIKSYPYIISHETFKRDIKKLTGLGDKTLFKIKEFLDNGFIKESREISSSERFQSLSLFVSIYGIGPVNARNLYDIGLRTIDDLERYYDLPSRDSGSGAFSARVIEDELVVMTPNGKRVPLEALRTSKGSGRDTVLPDLSVKIGLMLRDELELPIPREEVEEIHQVVMSELEKLQPGCVSTIVGGYRRGKEKSNDVDIVIGHPDLKSGSDKIKGLCKRFIQHLHSNGMVTHVMHLSSFHAPNALRTSNWDSLEKALTVFMLPPNRKNPERKRIRRRLDLIFAAPETYWTAVIGWSGSRLFERDLRSWAKHEKGLKFDSSGLTRRHDSRLFLPRSEEEIFEILGLDWIDPTMRNANV